MGRQWRRSPEPWKETRVVSVWLPEISTKCRNGRFMEFNLIRVSARRLQPGPRVLPVRGAGTGKEKICFVVSSGVEEVKTEAKKYME